MRKLRVPVGVTDVVYRDDHYVPDAEGCVVVSDEAAAIFTLPPHGFVPFEDVLELPLFVAVAADAINHAVAPDAPSINEEDE